MKGLSAHHRCSILPALTGLVLACSIGEGQGVVTSERLQAGRCWDGPYDLQPDFFAATPFQDTLNIRIQRGEEGIGVSDGVSMLVSNVASVRGSRLGEPLSLGLPQGVRAAGYPLELDPPPRDASLSLYLNDSCRNQSITLYAVDGTLRFTRLFSGDPNEDDAEDRLTEGTFSAIVADVDSTRQADATNPAEQSIVEGTFSFVFHRGTPAQAFP